jgi:WD40 repeat protein
MTIADMDYIFKSLPSSQLQDHIKNSLVKMTDNRYSDLVSSSLLRPLTGYYNSADRVQVQMSVELSSRLSDILGEMRANRAKSENLADRRRYLENSLQNIDLEEQGNTNCADFGEGSSSNSQRSLLRVLQQVGQRKELKYISHSMEVSADSKQKLSESIDDVEGRLRGLGYVSSGVDRGSIDSGAFWLDARAVGLAGGVAQQSAAGLSCAFAPSAMRMHQRILTRYRSLYTINGHMMNAAYCSVFDVTGRFLITGADDYLVKIWDVEAGLLVRTCRGHNAYISYIIVSPDNYLLASADIFGSIRVWRLKDGQCLNVMKHRDRCSVNWLKFDPTTCSLASAADDGRCIVWDLSRLLPSWALSECPFFQCIAPPAEGSPQEEERNLGISSDESSDCNCDNDCSDDAESVEENVMIAGTFEMSSFSTTLATESSSNAATTEGRYTGFFEWSRRRISTDGANNTMGLQSVPAVSAYEDPLSCSLALPHISDIFHAGGSREKLKVTCVDVSPCGNVLVTGCEDGVARVWRFGDVVHTVTPSVGGAGEGQIVSTRSITGRRTTEAHTLLQQVCTARYFAVQRTGCVCAVVWSVHA